MTRLALRVARARSRWFPLATIPLTASVVGSIALAFFLLPVACSGSGQSEDGANEKPLVVTTIPVIYSLTVSLAGDTVRVENLLPSGTSPHQFSLSPSQGRLLQDADLLIMNGAGLEPWIDDILASVAAKAMEVVIASEGIRLLPPPNYKAQVDGEQTDTAGEDSDHEGMDPHVWLDARNAITMTENIQRALQALDPDHTATYTERGQAFRERLAALHSDIADRTAGLPHRDFIAFHSAFTYYAEAYGLRQVAIIEESPGRSPSPRYLARLVDLIRDSGVRAVFTEPQFSPRSAEALAAETGVDTHEVDPEGSDLSPSMYENLMRKNTDVFIRALGGGE